MAGETFFSLVLNFKASHSHLLAREGDPGGWDLVSVSLFLLHCCMFRDSIQLPKACSDQFIFLHFFFQEPIELCANLKSWVVRSPLEIPRVSEALGGTT